MDETKQATNPDVIFDEIVYGDERELWEAAASGKVPNSMAGAAAHNRVVGQLLAKAEQIRAAYDAEIVKLSVQRELEVDRLRTALDQHNRIVELWHRRALADNEPGISKTVTFPTGPPSKLIDQSNTPELVVEDEEAFKAWATEAGRLDEFYPMKRGSLAKQALGELEWQDHEGEEPGTILHTAGDDGEPLPGVHRRARGYNWPTTSRSIKK